MTKLKSNAEINVHIISNIYTQGPGKNNLLVIAHRDLDGLISAFLLATSLRREYKNIDVLFSQPYLGVLLRKYIVQNCSPSKYQDLALLDLSVDYVNPSTTQDLFTYIQPRLRYIFDHHSGWDKLLRKFDLSNFNVHIDGEYHTYNKDNRSCIVLGNEPCCANLVYEFFKLELLNDTYLNDILRIAIISDDLHIRQDMEQTNLYHAFINLKNKTIEDGLKEILSSTSISEFKVTNINWYSKNTGSAMKLLHTAEEIYPGIGYIKCFSDVNINYTHLCELAYKKYKIIIVKELNAKKMRISFTIAHLIPDLDLTKLFKLQGGNPRRVTLCRRGITIHTIVNKLKPFLN